MTSFCEFFFLRLFCLFVCFGFGLEVFLQPAGVDGLSWAAGFGLKRSVSSKMGLAGFWCRQFLFSSLWTLVGLLELFEPKAALGAAVNGFRFWMTSEWVVVGRYRSVSCVYQVLPALGLQKRRPFFQLSFVQNVGLI